MNKAKITSHQLFSLSATGSIGGSVFIISSLVANIAKQDAWITAVFMPILGIPVIAMYCFIGSQYPNMTLVGILKKVLGKWLGIIIAIGYMLFYLTTAFRIPWYMGNFITTNAMPETPAYVINLVLIVVIITSLLYGIESIARASEILIYIVLILFFLSIIFVLPNAKIENLQPILENGIVPVLKATVFLTCLTTFSLVTLMMIYPISVTKISDAQKSIFKGYFVSGCVIFITIIVSIMVLGASITSKTQYPTYLLGKEIDMGVIFTRLEFIITAVWIVTQSLIGILFSYAGITVFSEILGLKDYKKIVAPFGIIMLVFSQIMIPNPSYQANWTIFASTPYIITYGLVIPVVLLLVFLIKKWIFKIK